MYQIATIGDLTAPPCLDPFNLGICKPVGPLVLPPAPTPSAPCSCASSPSSSSALELAGVALAGVVLGFVLSKLAKR